jgi:Domain of unknown function (DUF4440)
MSADDKTLIGLLEGIAESLRPAEDLPHHPDRSKDPHSSWREEVIIVHCVGRGKVSRDGKVINLQMHMYDLQGKWVGFQLGVHESESSFEDLVRVPPQPEEGPQVPKLPIREWTKGEWTFADGSAVYAAGQAHSHFVPLTDGSALFMVATGQVLTGGTGRYEGCHGIKEATGTTVIPRQLLAAAGGRGPEAGPTQFPPPGLEFDAKTVEVFRILKRQDLKKEEPTPGPPEPEHPHRREEHEIKEVQERVLRALEHRDTATLERIWSEDWFLKAPFGVASKAQVLESLRSGRLVYRARTEEAHVKLHDDIAEVTGRAHVEGSFEGRDLGGRYRYHDWFRKRGGDAGWQITFEELAPESHP